MNNAINLNYISENSDRDYREDVLKDDPWIFMNLLPLEIKVWVKRPAIIDEICSIKPFGTVSKSYSKTGLKLGEGDEIHVIYSPAGTNGPDFEILRSLNLFADSRIVRLGDIVYLEKHTTYNQRSHSDIMGIRFHNHITIPIEIYKNGKKLAYIDRDDGTGYQAGSRNSAYVTNDNYGFNIGDEVVIKLFNGRRSIDYCSIIIPDNYLSEIYVGVIKQKYTEPIMDMYSYRVDRSNINGLQYYHNVSGYQTKPTYIVN